MGPDVYQQYQYSRVLDADPVELIGMLYRGAREAVGKARQHLRDGDVFARGRQISRAQEIVAELGGALQLEQGELASNLARLYDYMHRRLQEAHATSSSEALAEVEILIETLIDAWDQVQMAAQTGGPRNEEAAEHFSLAV